MACEIDQNVNLVCADLLGELGVGETDRVLPVVAEQTKSFGGSVLGGDA